MAVCSGNYGFSSRYYITINTKLNKSCHVFAQLQEVFVAYKKEKIESEKGQTEQNEKLQDQVTELRSENMKISTQLEFTSKRYLVISLLVIIVFLNCIKLDLFFYVVCLSDMRCSRIMLRAIVRILPL